jgi:hypothetical protein
MQPTMPLHCCNKDMAISSVLLQMALVPVVGQSMPVQVDAGGEQESLVHQENIRESYPGGLSPDEPSDHMQVGGKGNKCCTDLLSLNIFILSICIFHKSSWSFQTRKHWIHYVILVVMFLF